MPQPCERHSNGYRCRWEGRPNSHRRRREETLQTDPLGSEIDRECFSHRFFAFPASVRFLTMGSWK